MAGSPGDLAVVVTKRTTDDPPLRPVATRGFAVLGSLRASNIGADVTLLSGGCKVAFGPMLPDIGADFTRAEASGNGAKPWHNGAKPQRESAKPQRESVKPLCEGPELLLHGPEAA